MKFIINYTINIKFYFINPILIITIIIFTCLLFRLIILAERQRSVFSRVFGYGVASILFCHFLINIGMTIGIIPVIGIPIYLIGKILLIAAVVLTLWTMIVYLVKAWPVILKSE